MKHYTGECLKCGHGTGKTLKGNFKKYCDECVRTEKNKLSNNRYHGVVKVREIEQVVLEFKIPRKIKSYAESLKYGLNCIPLNRLFNVGGSNA